MKFRDHIIPLLIIGVLIFLFAKYAAPPLLDRLYTTQTENTFKQLAKIHKDAPVGTAALKNWIAVPEQQTAGWLKALEQHSFVNWNLLTIQADGLHDPWGNLCLFEIRADIENIDLRMISAGADETLGTEDDIVVTGSSTTGVSAP